MIAGAALTLAAHLLAGLVQAPRVVGDRGRGCRESEERFRVMADTAPVMIWLAGSDRRYGFFNATLAPTSARTNARAKRRSTVGPRAPIQRMRSRSWWGALLSVRFADASVTAWRRGDRRKALLVGGSIEFFLVAAFAGSLPVLWGDVQAPIVLSLPYMGLVAVMGYEAER